eukprot:GDKI01043017.1.p1 GENE.GDKI01043017.1~~GDKI01043017.1.p1  ORF type:complete len:600 (-),score=155.17 GDKI01043017.1:442-2241(-)
MIANREEFDPPTFLGGDLFKTGSESESESEKNKTQQEKEEESCVTRPFKMPNGMEINIREMAFHCLNANFVWHGNYDVAQWLLDHKINEFKEKNTRLLELGAATGILSIFLKRHGVDVIASDYDDTEIESNFHKNLELNGMSGTIPFIRHTWGEHFPDTYTHPTPTHTGDTDTPSPRKSVFDAIVASDILLYIKSFPQLVETCNALRNRFFDEIETRGDGVSFNIYMGWNRRTEYHFVFFEQLKRTGWKIEKVDKQRIWVLSATDKFDPSRVALSPETQGDGVSSGGKGKGLGGEVDMSAAPRLQKQKEKREKQKRRQEKIEKETASPETGSPDATETRKVERFRLHEFTIGQLAMIVESIQILKIHHWCDYMEEVSEIFVKKISNETAVNKLDPFQLQAAMSVYSHMERFDRQHEPTVKRMTERIMHLFMNDQASPSHLAHFLHDLALWRSIVKTERRFGRNYRVLKFHPLQWLHTAPTPDETSAAEVVSKTTPMEKLGQHICKRVHFFTPQQLARTLRALSYLDFPDEPFYRVFVPFFRERIEDLGSQDIKFLQDAFNKRKIQDSDFFWRLGKRFQTVQADNVTVKWRGPMSIRRIG